MGLADSYIDVGLTRPEDIVEQLQWEKYERAMAGHGRRVRARQRAGAGRGSGARGARSAGRRRASCGSRSSPSPASKRGRSGRSEGAEGAVNKRRGVGDAKAPSRNKVAPSPGAVVEMVEVKRADALAAMKKPGSRRGCKPCKGRFGFGGRQEGQARARRVERAASSRRASGGSFARRIVQSAAAAAQGAQVGFG